MNKEINNARSEPVSHRKKVVIVGMGLGEGTTTPEARKAVARADVLLGAPRMLALCEDAGKPAYPCYLPHDVIERIEAENAREFAVLVSGDVGFYSAAAGLCGALCAYDLRFVPGISAVSAFFAKVQLPWQDAAFVSVHGREMNVADTVRRNRLTFCLPGGKANEIGAAMSRIGLGRVAVYVGENLGAGNEKIYETAAEELALRVFSPLSVLLFLNDAYDDRLLCGLPDESFARLADVPMTKSETRALVASKLRLGASAVCWDIGAGTGSVTVEMALCAYRGRVYAIERREDAIRLIRQNCAAFHVGNVTAVHGEAPGALELLPMPDAVCIGGSGGRIGEIIPAVLQKNGEARVVVTAVTIETVSAALDAFATHGLRPEIVQINAARSRRAGGLHLMEAQNPVTILCAGGKL